MNYDEWKKWWVDRAQGYFTDKIWRFSHPDIIKRLDIRKTQSVLEIGFGYGRELSQFCGLSDHVYGLELTDWACENTLTELKSRGVEPLPRLRSYSGLLIPFPSESFQVIYSCFVIQHLSRLHALELVRESLRCLSHHGKVLFEFFGDPAYHDGGQDMFSGDPDDGGMYNNAYVADEIRTLLKECGARLEWMETKSVTSQWGNHWACFSRDLG